MTSDGALKCDVDVNWNGDYFGTVQNPHRVRKYTLHENSNFQVVYVVLRKNKVALNFVVIAEVPKMLWVLKLVSDTKIMLLLLCPIFIMINFR